MTKITTPLFLRLDVPDDSIILENKDSLTFSIIFVQFHKVTFKNECSDGTSQMVQRLRLCLPVQRAQVQTLVRELRSHVPWGPKTKT